MNRQVSSLRSRSASAYGTHYQEFIDHSKENIMNDFLQLQPKNMTPYIWVSAVIAVIGVFAAILSSSYAIHGMNGRKRMDDLSESHSAVDICMHHFMTAAVLVGGILAITFGIGIEISTINADNRNMQMIQSAYNIRDVQQNAITSGGVFQATVQTGKNSEQNVSSIKNLLAGEGGSATVTATSNESDSIGHYIFRVDDSHRLRVYQDTGNSQHLITPAKQDAAVK